MWSKLSAVDIMVMCQYIDYVPITADHRPKIIYFKRMKALVMSEIKNELRLAIFYFNTIRDSWRIFVAKHKGPGHLKVCSN